MLDKKKAEYKKYSSSQRVSYKKDTRMTKRISDKIIFVVNQCYAVTLTPLDKNQFFENKDRYQKFHNRIYNTVMDQPLDYDFVVEITEPLGFKLYYEGPRLHCHGVIRFNSRKQISAFLLYGHRRLCALGGVDIDTIDDMNIWNTYCRKQHILPANRHMYNTHLLPTLDQKNTISIEKE